MSSDSNPQLGNVRSAFDAISLNCTKHELTGGPAYIDLSQSHLQGFARYGEMYLVTQNRHGKDDGRIYFFNSVDGTQIGNDYLRVDGNNASQDKHKYNHPGAIQVIGDYMVVPIQTQDYNNTVVQLYELDKLTHPQARQLCKVNADYLRSTSGTRFDGKFGAVGIAKVGAHFILAVADDSTVSFYQSTTNQIASTNYELMFNATVAGKPTSLNLLCDTSGALYMVDLTVTDDGASYADYATLSHVDLHGQVVSQLSQRHFISTSSTFVGPHFRWGAGTYFPGNGTLGILATQRVMQATCEYDIWVPPA